MDEKKIVAIVRGLLTGDGDIIQPIVDQYFTDDIVFEHPLFTVSIRAASVGSMSRVRCNS